MDFVVNKLTNGPRNRIRLNGPRIQVGDKDFTSASEALLAYLDQYAGIFDNSSKYGMDVSDLLDPKSSLRMTAERSLQTGIRDTRTELRLAQTKDKIVNNHERMIKSTSLRAEAEVALDKSGALLDRISRDEPEPAHSNLGSDTGSLSTDLLLTMDPSAINRQTTAAIRNTEPTRRGHVYSYRTEKTRSRSLSRERSDEREIYSMPKRENLGNRPPTSYKSLSSKSRERSRSVSPSSFRMQDEFQPRITKTLPRWESDSDTGVNSPKYKSPSWIEALDISNPSENLWSKRELHVDSSRAPPSWVNGLDASEISSIHPQDSSKSKDINNLLLPDLDSSLRDASVLSNPPGLTFNDLASTPNKGKTVNFDLTSTEFKRPKDPLNNYSISSKLPKEVLESDRLNSSDIVKKYTKPEETIQHPKEPDTSVLESLLSKGDNSYHDPPRCSSLDTEALLSGLPAPIRSDISGASPINSDLGRSPGRNSRRGRRGRPETPDTDLVLDGDRPWEKPVGSIKSPVYMTGSRGQEKTLSEADTLTGQQQPGSMEALKNMLFKLQEESTRQSNSSKEKISQLIEDSKDLLGEETKADIPALEGYNFQEEPGGQCLERAMVHLNRLKNLVETRSRSQSRERGGSQNHSRESSLSRSLSRSRSVSPLRQMNQELLNA